MGKGREKRLLKKVQKLEQKYEECRSLFELIGKVACIRNDGQFVVENYELDQADRYRLRMEKVEPSIVIPAWIKGRYDKLKFIIS